MLPKARYYPVITTFFPRYKRDIMHGKKEERLLHTRFGTILGHFGRTEFCPATLLFMFE